MRAYKASKAPLTLDSQVIVKNRSYQSLTSNSSNNKVNHTIMNYVQKRLAEYEYKTFGITTPQKNLFPKSTKKAVNPKIYSHTNTFKTKSKPIIELNFNKSMEKKVIVNPLLVKNGQRSKSSGHPEVIKLQKENKSLKQRLEVYQNQINRLQIQMNEYINQSKVFSKDNNEEINYLLSSNNEMDNTINSLSISAYNDQ